MTPVIIAGIIIAGILSVIGIIRANLKICQPNEVLVFSGRKNRLSDGSIVGYRTIQGGRGFRIPIIETVDRINLTTIPIDLMVSNAYSKGGIPLTVRAIANVKIASDEVQLRNAMERLLGKGRDEVQEIAKETLEGNLRGVVSQLSPEEVNEDRLAFARTLINEADDDMNALGIQLDTLKIQSVEDDRGYLDAIGRQRTAEIIAAAEIVEAKKNESARLAEASANKAIITAENEVRVMAATLAAQAEAEEAKIGIAAQLAETKAAQELAVEEISLAEKRQRSLVIVPAEAEREAKEESAKGNAARILEDGKAEVEILREKLRLWKEAGPDAEQLFLIQMLPDIMREVISTVKDVKIDKLTVVDGGQGGSGVPAVLSQLANAAPAVLESLKASTGIDVAGMLSRAGDHRKESPRQIAAVDPDSGK